MVAPVVGIDIGGSKGAVAVYPNVHSTVVIPNTTFNFPVTPGDFEADYRLLLRGLYAMKGEFGGFSGFGISLAGPIEPEGRYLASGSGLKHWARRPIVQLLEEEFNCPVVLGNDAVGAALAVALYNLNCPDNFLLVVWGSGLGGTLVLNQGGAITTVPTELGHQVIDITNRELCLCGQIGCLEAEVGGLSLEHKFGDPRTMMTDTRWDVVLDLLATGLHNACVITQTKHIFLTGGVAVGQKDRLPQLERFVASNMKVVKAPSISLSPFAESPTLSGLALLRKAVSQ